MSRGRPWTALDTFELRRLAGKGLTFREIGERMGRDIRHVRERAIRHGIAVRRVAAPRRKWSAADDARLRELFPTYSALEISDALGCTLSAVHNRAHTLGLRKSAGWKSERTERRWLEGRYEASRAHQFRPGFTPWNKGIPGSTGTQPGCRATQFKPGRKASEARNYLPIGSLRVTRDGTLERKVTDDPRIVSARRWVAVARLVWEAAHGPIPPKHVVRFLPGMHTSAESEITPDRLECISMAENMRRNTVHNYPAPLKQVMRLRGALTRKINNRTRNHKDMHP